MKVAFRQSGGFAGLIEGCDLDTDLLSADEAAQLQSLVEHSGILQAKSEVTPNAQDIFNYQITVETTDGTRHISFDDMTLPESAVSLLEYLQERAEHRPPT
ncbi:MAG: protealysin inhibitor emfourin [Xenococcaceae cyanobacterium]